MFARLCFDQPIFSSQASGMFSNIFLSMLHPLLDTCSHADKGFIAMISGQGELSFLGNQLLLPVALLFGVTERFLISHHIFPWPSDHLEAT